MVEILQSKKAGLCHLAIRSNQRPGLLLRSRAHKVITMFQNKRVAVVIPAKDEEQAIRQVLEGLQLLPGDFGAGLIDEIVVCDNGSVDDTATVARSLGARVVSQAVPGYGIACLTAIDHIQQADIVLFIDGDNAFRATQAIPLIHAVASGYDLAIGSRTQGSSESGSLTLPQRFGNWLAATLIYWIWGEAVSDLGPFRAISYPALMQLKMKDERFGWTVEMQIKAIQHGMQTVEIPVDTYRRIGESKISGTVKGSIGAGLGILSMIYKLRQQSSAIENRKMAHE